MDAREVQIALDAAAGSQQNPVTTGFMRGPTGELNRWSTHPRGTVLCLGPTIQDAEDQMRIARDMGCPSVGIAPGLSGPLCISGVLASDTLLNLKGLGLVVFWGAPDQATKYWQSLAAQNGPIIPLTNAVDFETACLVERHLCVDTTAVGGNTDLMA